MVSIMKINSPLGVPVGRKNFTLNLNVYRNAHYQILNKAKQNYKIFMSRQISLVYYKKIEDDNFNFVTKSIYSFGKKDAENPRVEIFIKEIE